MTVDFTEFEFEDEKGVPRSNLSAPATACTTCGGDRFVVVSLRKPVQSPWMKERGIEVAGDATLEEYAPCPDCNAQAHPEFRRFDGTMAVAPDPGKVRDALTAR